jgi:hypothetical protein
MLYERYMFNDLEDYINQVAYFSSKEIVEKINLDESNGYIEPPQDALELIESFCNCSHMHGKIMEEIANDIQREVWDCGFGISIEHDNYIIFWHT